MSIHPYRSYWRRALRNLGTACVLLITCTLYAAPTKTDQIDDPGSDPPKVQHGSSDKGQKGDKHERKKEHGDEKKSSDAADKNGKAS
jgi:hypothetical protein